MLVCYCVCAALAALYWMVAAAENRRKAARCQELNSELPEASEPTDMTDSEQAGFRYIT